MVSHGYKGRIEQVGTPVDIFVRPASLFVADFIGRANFIETKIQERKEQQCLINAFGGDYWVPCAESVTQGDTAYLMIRPEAIEIKPAANGNKNGEIQSTVFLGASVEYEIDANGNHLIAVDTSPRFDQILKENCPVEITFDPNRSYVLPYEDRN